MAKTKSLGKNMALNALRNLMTVIFPFITYPYVSRVLGVEAIGKTNLALSVVSYFVLLADLGISTYAIREGARIRNSGSDLTRFSQEMLSLNAISTLFSCALFFCCVLLSNRLRQEWPLLLIASGQLLFKWLGVEWLYTLREDFSYITLRSVLCQIVSIFLLFALVRRREDYPAYLSISVFSVAAANLVSFFYARRHTALKLKGAINWRRHLRPILVLFGVSAASTVYISSDTTLLGFLADDYAVGLYSTSAKLYTMLKLLISSVIVTGIPRLTAFLGEGQTGAYRELAARLHGALIALVLPMTTGLLLLSDDVILLIAAPDFLPAASSLRLLSVALCFCALSWFWSQCVLVPQRREKTVFAATLLGAALNIALNLALIPAYKENAAAFTTILAEMAVLLFCAGSGRKLVALPGAGRALWKALTGCAGMALIVWAIRLRITALVPRVACAVAAGAAVYAAIEAALGNEAVLFLARPVLNRLAARRAGRAD